MPIVLNSFKMIYLFERYKDVFLHFLKLICPQMLKKYLVNREVVTCLYFVKKNYLFKHVSWFTSMKCFLKIATINKSPTIICLEKNIFSSYPRPRVNFPNYI